MSEEELKQKVPIFCLTNGEMEYLVEVKLMGNDAQVEVHCSDSVDFVDRHYLFYGK